MMLAGGTQAAMKRRRRQSLLSGGLIFSASLAVGLLLFHFGVDQKWEAPAFWTTVCFATVIPLCRRRWHETDFWVRLTAIFATHVAGMLVLFDRVIMGRTFPWIITVPLIWAEVVLILRLVNVQETRPRHE
ncbi:MAG: hypothetical protein WBD06_15535 [Acidobacteriaceae bacterium]